MTIGGAVFYKILFHVFWELLSHRTMLNGCTSGGKRNGLIEDLKKHVRYKVYYFVYISWNPTNTFKKKGKGGDERSVRTR